MSGHESTGPPDRGPTSGAPAGAVTGGLASVGILLVHGIGEPRPGQTLQRFGAPLIRWLRGWLGSREGSVELLSATLRPHGTEPAHSRIRVTVRDGEHRRSSDWWLAESFWGRSFETPSFGSVAFWAFRVIPWTLITQFGDPLSRSLGRRHWGGILLYFGFMGIVFPAAVALQVLAIGLVPLALVPRVRRVVVPIQHWVAARLGDSYALLQSELQFRAMVTQVQRDLVWLKKRGVAATAVVAHSQGAAVAHAALSEESTEPVDRFITLGSGLAKLRALRTMLDRGGNLLWGSTFVSIAVVALGVFYVHELLDLVESAQVRAWGVVGLGGILALTGYALPLTLVGINDAAPPDALRPRCDRWVDCYASADPVPNGPLFAENPPFLDSRRVHNAANFLTDHSRYVENDDELAGIVIAELIPLMGAGAGAQDGRVQAVTPTGKDVEEASASRSGRVRSLVRARGVAVAAITLLGLEHPLLEGDEVVAPGWLRGLLALGLGRLERLVLTGAGDIRWPVFFLMVVVVWYVVMAGLWRVWNGVETRRWLAGSPQSRLVTAAHRAFLGGVVGLAASVAVYWVTWLITAPADVWRAIRDGVVWFVTGVVVPAVSSVGVALAVILGELIQRRFTELTERRGIAPPTRIPWDAWLALLGASKFLYAPLAEPGGGDDPREQIDWLNARIERTTGLVMEVSNRFQGSAHSRTALINALWDEYVSPLIDRKRELERRLKAQQELLDHLASGGGPPMDSARRLAAAQAALGGSGPAYGLPFEGFPSIRPSVAERYKPSFASWMRGAVSDWARGIVPGAARLKGETGAALSAVLGALSLVYLVAPFLHGWRLAPSLLALPTLGFGIRGMARSSTRWGRWLGLVGLSVGVTVSVAAAPAVLFGLSFAWLGPTIGSTAAVASAVAALLIRSGLKAIEA